MEEKKTNTLSQSLVAKRKKFSEIDFYPTPSDVTEALMKREKFEGKIWECASGDGSMSRVLEKYNEVYSSDIRSENSVYGAKGVDFLYQTRISDNIITNPPFCKAFDFINHAKKHTRKKIAIFQRLLFLESIKRYDLFNDPDFPLSKVLIFCKRVNLFEGGEKKKVSGTVAFAWFIWDKNYVGKPEVEWIKE